MCLQTSVFSSFLVLYFARGGKRKWLREGQRDGGTERERQRKRWVFNNRRTLHIWWKGSELAARWEDGDREKQVLKCRDSSDIPEIRAMNGLALDLQHLGDKRLLTCPVHRS